MFAAMFGRLERSLFNGATDERMLSEAERNSMKPSPKGIESNEMSRRDFVKLAAAGVAADGAAAGAGGTSC